MATYLVLLILLIDLILPASAADGNPRNENLLVAIQEMQKANYFTFVMLINMSPPDTIPGNITFLMPNDRMLSKIMLPEHAVAEFLLRHSIPSPLLFDDMKHFPSGSTIPTSEPDFMLKVSNNGRRSFYLNDVQLISPNICTTGSSIRCHGINGVFSVTESQHNSTPPSPTCSSATPQLEVTPATPSRASPPPAPGNPTTLTEATSPTGLGDGEQKSGSGCPLPSGAFLHLITTCMILSLVAGGFSNIVFST
ncbi:FAS1 domain-containing protein SELMODRAFT_448915-like [Telopea speciosissima]|uniref:FAS1 domain-containing protein SELMODRAFT_448915-like n=1 Tax=Telopea speciosissima TaxID=54955 RepID=UPI001CC7D66A|nr:FAS1 domain-containing protein SELMODRAFT_448915-like [Telopea speciosissima]